MPSSRVQMCDIGSKTNLTYPPPPPPPTHFHKHTVPNPIPNRHVNKLFVSLFNWLAAHAASDEV